MKSALTKYVSAAFAMTITPNSRAFAEDFVPRDIIDTNDLAILQALYGDASAWHLSLGTSFRYNFFNSYHQAYI